jgi:hypothetical protein
MTLSPIFWTAAALVPLALYAQPPYDIALIGDMPYGTANEPRYERLIADINRQNVEFTFHIGDTKSGSTRCDDSHYVRALGWFNSFQNPLIYSAGDNEWTDCMRANNGAYNPLDRLALIRKTYFSTNQSLGRRTITLQRESEDPMYSLYAENAMLVKAPVVYVTIHMPGSNNNLEYKTVQGAANPFYDNDREYTARNAANLAWLHKAFHTARDTNSLGVMILTQANMFESFMDTSTGATHSGFADFIAALRGELRAFKGEVVLVTGDSHYMRVHKPLTDQYPACISGQSDCKPFDAALDARGNTVLNFTNVEVPGSNNVHWVLAHIRPNSRNLFQFEFMIVPDPAVTASGVTAVATGPGTAIGNNTIETSSAQVTLDATKSTSVNFGSLSYSWSSTPGYPVPAIKDAGTATPTVQFTARGVYQLTVTVTDRTGASSTATITVRYV